MHFLPVAGQSWWLDAIGRIPMLTPAEEIELGTLIQKGQQRNEPAGVPVIGSCGPICGWRFRMSPSAATA
jgi:hypothetical protein